MSSSEVPAPANNAETPAAVEEPVALAHEQLDRIAAGSAPAVSINPADLQQTASAAVDVATALKGICCTTTGIIAPDIWK
jgi:hypothetical protein